jgi:hypothetical protein
MNESQVFADAVKLAPAQRALLEEVCGGDPENLKFQWKVQVQCEPWPDLFFAYLAGFDIRTVRRCAGGTTAFTSCHHHGG